MKRKPPPVEDEPGAQERFDAAVGRALGVADKPRWGPIELMEFRGAAGDEDRRPTQMRVLGTQEAFYSSGKSLEDWVAAQQASLGEAGWVPFQGTPAFHTPDT